MISINNNMLSYVIRREERSWFEPTISKHCRLHNVDGFHQKYLPNEEQYSIGVGIV